jgi:hypothetical protein
MTLIKTNRFAQTLFTTLSIETRSISVAGVSYLFFGLNMIRLGFGLRLKDSMGTKVD